MLFRLFRLFRCLVSNVKAYEMLLRDILGFISLIQCLKPSESSLSWPAGTYGIPKPQSGCPKTDHFHWLEGWRSQGSNSRNLNNSCSVEFHLDGKVDNTMVNRSFCIKDDIVYDSARPAWPKGQYCIYKNRKCPNLTKSGKVYWDDERSSNTNAKGGTLPGGLKDSKDNTEIRFCCRTDGDKKEPIILPTKLSFFLLAYGSNQCQMVKWAIATLEWIYFDTEDENNKDHAADTFPFDAGKKNPRIYYCYYSGCNKSLGGTNGTFHSPNYPEKYPDGQYCSWNITVSPSQRIHLMFTEFRLQNENNTDALYVYDGPSEKSKELGVFYGDTPPKGGINSTSNEIFVIFKSDRNMSFTGFSALYCENKCPAEATTAASTLSSTTTTETSLKKSTTSEQSEATTAASTLSPTTTTETSLKKSTTSEESTTTKAGARRGKREESKEKGVNVVAVVVPVVVLIILVLLVLAGFIYYKRRRSIKLDKDTPNVIYASPQLTHDNPSTDSPQTAHDNPSTDSPQTAHDNPSTDRSTGRAPLSVGNPCYERGFVSIANDECSEAFELYSSLNPNTMDRREACEQPDEHYQTLYRGAPVYDTLEPGQAASNPIYESTS